MIWVGLTIAYLALVLLAGAFIRAGGSGEER